MSQEYKIINGFLEVVIDKKISTDKIQRFIGLIELEQKNEISLAQLERKAGGLHLSFGEAVHKLRKHWKKAGVVASLIAGLTTCSPPADLTGSFKFNMSGEIGLHQSHDADADLSKMNVQESQRNQRGSKARSASGGAKEEGQNITHARSPQLKPRGRVK